MRKPTRYYITPLTAQRIAALKPGVPVSDDDLQDIRMMALEFVELVEAVESMKRTLDVN